MKQSNFLLKIFSYKYFLTLKIFFAILELNLK